MSGHQPELFHPGVWVKNFAAHSLACQLGGSALHLVVDNDTVKGTTVRVPTGSAAEPGVVHLPLDRWQGEIPFEEYLVGDEALFAGFGRHLTAAVEQVGVRPLAEDFWRFSVEAAQFTRKLGERIAWARRRQEAAWGCHSLELPVSRLCQTESFYWFACHVLAQLPRFREVYNQALEGYRDRHRLRSRHHPMPPLAHDGDWLEAPFWLWSEQVPRRRQLFARQQGQELVLADRDQWTATLPLAPDREACCAVEVMEALARQGIKLRTRALTTTIFSRLCLADLFMHGLGGARYDEVTDEIIRKFFHLEPPKFLTLTGSLHLPIVRHDATTEEVRRLQRTVRDLTYNPDRHLDRQLLSDERLAASVQAKWKHIRSEPGSRAERRNRFTQIRQLNEFIAQSVPGVRDEVVERLDRARAGVRANAIISNRDWAFCVYPAETLHGFFQPFLETASPIEGSS
ncbi:MAG: hypothetical protein HY000_38960 [Planctomycetes bacterium]|nr:hypothetical protein [Planctomycetota bacterium]